MSAYNQIMATIWNREEKITSIAKCAMFAKSTAQNNKFPIFTGLVSSGLVYVKYI